MGMYDGNVFGMGSRNRYWKRKGQRSQESHWRGVSGKARQRMLVEGKNSWERNYVLEKKGLEESGKVTEELVEGKTKGCWWRERITGIGEDY
jgi:hypothetical protein